MPDYEKPNMILPVSLHDARLNHIEIADDTICFVIEDGIRTIQDDQVEQTGKTQIFFGSTPKFVDEKVCAILVQVIVNGKWIHRHDSWFPQSERTVVC
ncbi:hypothetical protein NE454_11890 [Blautia producta]|uniref:hypothetical protein n=1 Tax=Blautia producta TaxID=33035 RepID=UPI00210B9869|nr:hypothetical protein [Blautia producta]MCQ5125112.1 hypothetical protein [Blautia producta]